MKLTVKLDFGVGEEIKVGTSRIVAVSPDIPLHVTRFFPRFQMTDAEPTPVAAIRRLVSRAGRILSRVLPGNCWRVAHPKSTCARVKSTDVPLAVCNSNAKVTRSPKEIAAEMAKLDKSNATILVDILKVLGL